jgi:hemerythrin-like domain-containing protein
MTRQLEQIYQQHIRLEEQVVFPFAARILEAQSIAQMGEEFRVRREQAARPTNLH